MRYKLLKQLFLCILSLGLFACNKNDLRGMFFSYNDVNERFDQSMSWNDAHPYANIVSSENEYQVFVMADSHIGTTKNYQVFIDNSLKASALAVVLNGDITTGYKNDYIRLKNLIPSNDSIYSFLLVGNHELYYDGWKQFYSQFGSSIYYFTVSTPTAKDIFICLDSGSGTLGSKQMNWLKKILKKRNLYRNCFVFTHNNFYRNRHTSSTNPLIEEVHVLIDLFLTNNVDLVIMGHDHQRSIYTLGNTTYLTLDGFFDGFDDASYLKLTIDNNNMDYTFIPL